MNNENFWWLTGFIDGEGHLGIYANGKRKDGMTRYRVEFCLKVRDDDEETIKYCRSLTGLGKIYSVYKKTEGNPQTMWKIAKAKELLEFTKIIDGHLLRTKKAREYIYWRRAVILMQSPPSAERSRLLRYCKKQIEQIRKYEKAFED